MNRDPMSNASFVGLELLATAVVVVDRDLRVSYVNPAAESLLALSGRALRGQRFSELFSNADTFEEKLANALVEERGFWDQSLSLSRASHETLDLNCIVTPIDPGGDRLLIELRHIEQRLRVEREEQQMTQHLANRELIRNLAHEIKNPLGGIRGAAQLLELELNAPEYREYTQVIIKEADRLQTLVDRLLAPHRRPHIVGDVNVHEVCERVRSVILAEFPKGLDIERDYDTSVPEFRGDKEQLIQALLNIAHNAAQALRNVIAGGEPAEIIFRTRIARQVTIAKKRYRLALELHVIDNGPGIPEDIKERIFFPLVSGREGGSGLGLTLAQTFVQQHHGVIECESRPGRTDFKILLPLP